MIKRFDTEIDNINHSGKVIIKVYHEDKVYYNAWFILSPSAIEEINTKFGSTDGPKVINAAQQYIKSLGKEKGSNLLQFINEDPMMVCSLGLEVEGVTMPIRWLVGDGNSWIDSGVLLDGHDKIEFEFRDMQMKDSQQALFGLRQTGVGDISLRQSKYASNYIYDWYYSSGTASTYTTLNVTGAKVTIDGGVAKIATNTITRTTLNLGFTNTFWLFALNANGSVGIPAIFSMNHFIDEGKCNLVPFVSQTRDGMIDLVNMEFHPNQGTGHFTDAYTLPDGTPWTPSTP